MADLSLSERIAEEYARGKLDVERATNIPGIPTPTLDLKSVRDTVMAIKQIIDTRENRVGSVLDKNLTFRDLMDSSTLRVKVGTDTYVGNAAASLTINSAPFADPRPTLNTPPVLTDLAATGAFRQILLTWTRFDYRNHAYVEIYRHTADTIGSAVLIGTTPADIYDDSSGVSATLYYYWVRAVNTSGQHGAFNAVSGVSATLAQAGTGDLTVGSITAASGIIGSLSADVITTGTLAAARIAAGSLNAEKITAGTITVDRLIIRGSPGGNGVPDPEGRDITAWTGGAFTAVADTTSPSGRALSMTSSGSSNYGSGPIPIDRAKNYLMRMTVKQHSGTPTNYLGIVFYDSSGAAVVGSGWPAQGTFDYWGLVNQTTPADWHEYTIAFGPACAAKMPATAVSCVPLFLANFSAAGELRATNISITEVPEGHLQWVERDVEMEVRGTSMRKRSWGTGSWTTAGFYSKTAYTGGAYIKFVPRNSACTLMVGLNTSAPSTSTNYTTLDYAMYCETAGDLYRYESNSGTSLGATYAAGDVLSVVYDGFNVRYMKNGTVLHTTAAANGLVLYADSTFYTVNQWVDSVEFGPMNPGTKISTSNIGTYIDSLSADYITAGSIRGINIQAAAFITKGSYSPSAVSAAATTLTLASTTDFAASGGGVFVDTTNDGDAFTYTGKTATTLTGCSGVLAHDAGCVVIPDNATVLVMSHNANEFRTYLNGVKLATVGTAGGGIGAGFYAEATVAGSSGFYGTANHATADGLLGVNTHTTNSGRRTGVYGRASDGIGVLGFNGSSAPNPNIRAGVHGESDNNNPAVRAVCTSSGTAVLGSSDSGYGGRFDGNATKANLATGTPLAARPSSGGVGDIAVCYTTGGGVGTRSATPRVVMYDGTNWIFVHDNSTFAG